MDDHNRAGQVTRREVLKKGLIGAAGLTVLPTVIAACSSTATTAPTTASNASTPPAVTAAPAASISLAAE